MRRTRTLGAAALVAAALPLVAPRAAAVPPATTGHVTLGGSFGGFATSASATPLRLEVHEPTIPMPTDPQVELDLAWTQVQGSSGPDATARSSTLWPGDAVGTGLKTIGEQFGLPPQLTANGYPVQANAQTPGGPRRDAQEPVPGGVSHASAGPRVADAQAGWSTSGRVSGPAPEGGQSGGATPGTGVLGGLSSGNLAALGQAMTGSGGAPGPAWASGNPLGALTAVVSAEGATSRSTTTYVGDTVVATATSRVHDLALLGGVVRLRGVEVVASTSSSLAGAHTRWSSHLGVLSIGGNRFTLDRDGVRAVGRQLPLPGLPDAPGAALAALGIRLQLPTPAHHRHGRTAATDVRGLKVTVDLRTLRSRLPGLPLDRLARQLPDSADQLKKVLGAAAGFAPRIVAYVGTARSSARTVPAISFPAPATGPAGSTTGAATTTGAPTGSTPAPGLAGNEAPAAPAAPRGAGAPVSSPGLQPVSDAPGLPPLGSVPGLLCAAGLAVAGLGGIWLRRAARLVLGAGATCSHGLRAGVPDLRKVSR